MKTLQQVLVLVVVVAGLLSPAVAQAQTATPVPLPTSLASTGRFPLSGAQVPSLIGESGLNSGWLCVAEVQGTAGASIGDFSCRKVTFLNDGIEDNGGQTWYDYAYEREIWTYVQTGTIAAHRWKLVFIPPPGVKSVQMVCSAYASTSNGNYTSLAVVGINGFQADGPGQPVTFGGINMTDAETQNHLQTESIFVNASLYDDTNAPGLQALAGPTHFIYWPATTMGGVWPALSIMATAERSLSTVAHSGYVDCMVSVRRNPAAPGGSASMATPTITPTLSITITPPSCLPGAIGYPCVGVGTPTPALWPTPAPWPTILFPTPLPWPTPFPGGSLDVGTPTEGACVTLVPGVEFSTPNWLMGIPVYSFATREFKICYSEVTFGLELFGINIGAWVLAMLTIGAGALLFNVIKRS